MAKALPRGVREKNGSYEARAVVNGIRINLYGTDVLDNMMEEEIKKFGVAKTQTPEVYYNEEIRRTRISAMSHC